MTVEKLRFGILGCGVIGPHHARAISGLETAELVATADIIPELAEELEPPHAFARLDKPGVSLLIRMASGTRVWHFSTLA